MVKPSIMTWLRFLFRNDVENGPLKSSRNTVPDLPNLSVHFRYAGKLLLRQEIDLDEPTFQSYLSQQLFLPTESISKHIFGYQCRRCGNAKRNRFARVPCARCHQDHMYCRNCIEMGRVLACEPLYEWQSPELLWPKVSDPCKWEGELTLYQKHASDQIAAAIHNGNEEILIWAVTGAGKTEMLFEGLALALHHGKRVCIATPRADVVRELIPRFRQAFPDISIAGLYGGSEDKQAIAPFIIATTHQLIRFVSAFDVIVIDEIDAFPYHLDPSLHFVAKRSAKPSATRIYLTATPRMEHQKRIKFKKLKAVFVPQRYHGHPLPVPVLKNCFDLRQALAKSTLPKAFYKWIHYRKVPSRQIIVFVPTITLAEKIKEYTESNYNLLNLKAKQRIAYSHSNDPDREQKIQSFRDGNIAILFTTTILERGVTFPSVDVAVLDAGHKVFDEAALVQIAGRAGRSQLDPTGEVILFHDGKTDAMVSAVKNIKKMNERR